MTTDSTSRIGFRRGDDELRALAEDASERLAGSSTSEVLDWAARTFGDNLIMASNMEDASLIDLVSKVQPGVDVLFLETGYHFAETLGTRDAVAQTYDVNIIDAMPEQTVEQQDATEGARLYERDPGRCCHLRKVLPLRNTLARYEAWITGLRRVDSPSRADTPLVTWDERNNLVKVNPLAAWTDEDMDNYIAEHNVLVNPLVPAGFPSIGCQPCTAKPAPGADRRSGRWAGSTKTECGLHA
ncbi:phosphoadenosine phosphosulfate reductase [Actinopolyspora lacussalsi]|nr:phosphoadenosine phosphosulfate reductase [Actinopolyspora lacussalsi]